MKQTATFELLGPLELGPPEDWVHLGWRGDTVSLCGEPCLEDLGPASAPPPGRCCPDCDRIRRERGL